MFTDHSAVEIPSQKASVGGNNMQMATVILGILFLYCGQARENEQGT
jgi:hypothetical protein